jgi:hypothetical protein
VFFFAPFFCSLSANNILLLPTGGQLFLPPFFSFYRRLADNFAFGDTLFFAPFFSFFFACGCPFFTADWRNLFAFGDILFCPLFLFFAADWRTSIFAPFFFSRQAANIFNNTRTKNQKPRTPNKKTTPTDRKFLLLLSLQKQ